jgi:hypothetical protein
MTKACFTLGVRPMVNPNPAFLLVQKFEISPKGFTLGVKSEIEKKLFTLPQILINAEI